MKDYQVFSDALNESLKEGWEIIGNLSTCFDSSSGKTIYSILIQEIDYE